MQHLAIICHPKRCSFIQMIAKTYVNSVKARGHTVTIRDLYRRHFDPVLSEDELTRAEERSAPAAIGREQRHLARADAIAFFFPLWWAFMPAMMKGYIDRVFSEGFAYGIDVDDMTPLLAGKKALIFSSSGADLAYLRRSKQWQSMEILMRDHILAQCGIELLDHVHFPSITPDISERAIAGHVERVRRVVAHHWSDLD